MKEFCLNTIPIHKLQKINNIQDKKLVKMGLKTIKDLLFHFPIRYEDRTQINSIKNLIFGTYVTVVGKVIETKIVFNNRRIMLCRITDGTGILTIKFFNFTPNIIKNTFTPGRQIIAYGEVIRGKYEFELIHPEYTIYKVNSNEMIKKTLTSIYPSTEGISQLLLRNLINQALIMLDHHKIIELIPKKLNKNLISFTEALHTIHNPPLDNLQKSEKKIFLAGNRLVFEELLAHNLKMLSIKDKIKSYDASPIPKNHKLINKLIANLPFSLTNSQKKVLQEIEKDISKNHPMVRLLQGDVGSGKTLVAALSALNVIAQGEQVALMVPTELLVEQHVDNLRQWFTPLGIEIGLLFGKQKHKERKAQIDMISNGKTSIVVGTHSLFQKQMRFNKLALIIIDEQHRFGVHQRSALWSKGEKNNFRPHQLIMTATPIPRTLAMINYADLDISIIDELPPGRNPVLTVIIPDIRRNKIISRVEKACLKGRQVYWVCPIIEESEILEAQAAEVNWALLKKALPTLNIGLIHGRMKLEEKKKTMNNFKNNKFQLLVTTTVIEVGVNVPNASLMIIENSERLGLAQLHQLRGRVGRGSLESYCILLYKPPLSEIAKRRLETIRNIHDGFLIAQLDLEIRGPGELLGTKQTGTIDFKAINILQNKVIISEAQQTAYSIHKLYPEKAIDIIDRWISKKTFDINVF
ncbi:ATP-dependent DNA helicase RecG [Candidatus Pantoea edessiphila]|uniref:ATP-dependent DNA helicase RecG n=1 Tax=Candidatus Pantoea edessiphila TaxID=2044610 RepID=A0A2P5T1K5_9GAMM|nr:ATP-dependent DNA helicase RecG [Candidatus Pantoea edessiphila]PPI88432.1 ATP-dependent DNA helicase RecG [Candidatus Pantoea edessiphila]